MKKPIIYELAPGGLWGTDIFIHRVLLLPKAYLKRNYVLQDLHLKLGCNHKCEPRIIETYEIPLLKGKLGLFATSHFSKPADIIIEAGKGTYYTYDGWREYGAKDKENYVIEFYVNRIQCIFEPVKTCKWQRINDPKDHKDNIAANVCFNFVSNNPYKLPILQVIAISNIVKNEQYYVSYGPEWWTKYANWLANKNK